MSGGQLLSSVSEMPGKKILSREVWHMIVLYPFACSGIPTLSVQKRNILAGKFNDKEKSPARDDYGGTVNVAHHTMLIRKRLKGGSFFLIKYYFFNNRVGF